MISWRNPGPEDRDLGPEDCREPGAPGRGYPPPDDAPGPYVLQR